MNLISHKFLQRTWIQNIFFLLQNQNILVCKNRETKRVFLNFRQFRHKNSKFSFFTLYLHFYLCFVALKTCTYLREKKDGSRLVSRQAKILQSCRTPWFCGLTRQIKIDFLTVISGSRIRTSPTMTYFDVWVELCQYEVSTTSRCNIAKS